MNHSKKVMDKTNQGMILMLGIPFDDHSSFMKGASQAPVHIRNALHSGSSNLCAELGTDLFEDNQLQDMGDLEFASGIKAFEHITNATSQLIKNENQMIALGGDHSITYPILKAFSKKYGRLNLLHLDAHPDLYDEYDGNRFSHASPIARIMENNLVERLVQVGIRASNAHQRRQAQRFNVEIYDMYHHEIPLDINFDAPLYISIDLDVLDPAFAPGVSHYEPGGLSTRELLGIIHKIQVPIVGADIVEFNPTRDPSGITAMVAVKILKEITAQMIQNRD